MPTTERFSAALQDRTFIVTGAAGGIGAEAVTQLAASGARVLALDISERRLKMSKESAWDGLPGHVDIRQLDVMSEPDVNVAIDEAASQWGRIDGLANIAGGIPRITSGSFDVDIREMSVDDWHDTLRLNLDSVFFFTRAATRHFADRQYGKVVNVASLAAFGNHPRMGNLAYDAAKAAVVGLTRSLSRTLGPNGIRVNAVAPGSTLSATVREQLDPEQVSFHERRTPLGVAGEPIDVANVISFLLSPLSDHLSGETIRVAGGLR